MSEQPGEIRVYGGPNPPQFETFADGNAVGSFRADERAGQKARLVDGQPVTRARRRVRFLHRLVPEQVGPPDCPIMLRWTLLGSSGDAYRVLLHRFPPNADDRDPHDHPCDFWTLVLAGGYDDLVPCQGCGWLHDLPVILSDQVPVGKVAVVPLQKCRRCGGTGLVVGDRMRRGSLRRRRAEHRHITKAGSGGCWSLVVMAPRRREWGFWKAGKWFEWKTYEQLFGFGMRCD